MRAAADRGWLMAAAGVQGTWHHLLCHAAAEYSKSQLLSCATAQLPQHPARRPALLLFAVLTLAELPTVCRPAPPALRGRRLAGGGAPCAGAGLCHR